jgi:HlyD family secretion protein
MPRCGNTAFTNAGVVEVHALRSVDLELYEGEFVIWETNEALKAPLSALFRSGQSWNAFVVENGLAKRREVETGHRADFDVKVLNGLWEGEIVIAHPSNLVADGIRVLAGKK